MPVAAFAGPGQFPLDCEYADGTPVIYSAEGMTAAGSSFGGPYVGDQGNLVAAATAAPRAHRFGRAGGGA